MAQPVSGSSGATALPPASPAQPKLVPTGLGTSGSSFGPATKEESKGPAIPQATRFARAVAGTWALIKLPFSLIYKILSVPVNYVKNKIWRPKDKVVDGETTISVQGPDGKIKKQTIAYALENNVITPEQAFKDHKVSKEYLTSKGWDTVEFTYKWWGMAYPYKGTLRKALNEISSFTIETAIEKGFISTEQAIAGGFMKAKQPAPAEKTGK